MNVKNFARQQKKIVGNREKQFLQKNYTTLQEF
uniref:GH26078p n=1 Tax=Drosophila melanogaster TaxID=7227 RepID=Q95SH6_DROME|nr:GH26078p [Drosophila melanogaster]ADI46797.1 RE63079p [Drosophila melanogaster]